MRILIVDNNIDLDCWGASDLCAMARQAAPGATITVRRAPQEDLPRSPDGYDRIIVSGSKTSMEEAPWIDQLETFMGRAVDRGTPLLGVCYGHQALARALGGKQMVRRGAHSEYGWAKIETVESRNRLFKGLPRFFHSFQAHQDEVAELPRGMTLLAKSDRCAIQAYELQGKPVFGIQFHPEKTLEAGERSLANRLKNNPKAECLNRSAGKKVYDPKVGETIFKNFIALEGA